MFWIINVYFLFFWVFDCGKSPESNPQEQNPFPHVWPHQKSICDQNISLWLEAYLFILKLYWWLKVLLIWCKGWRGCFLTLGWPYSDMLPLSESLSLRVSLTSSSCSTQTLLSAACRLKKDDKGRYFRVEKRRWWWCGQPGQHRWIDGGSDSVLCAFWDTTRQLIHYWGRTHRHRELNYQAGARLPGPSYILLSEFPGLFLLFSSEIHTSPQNSQRAKNQDTTTQTSTKSTKYNNQRKFKG